MVKTDRPEKCISCGVNLVVAGYSRFPCPQCGKEIGRCVSCRHQSNVYKCNECGFQGP